MQARVCECRRGCASAGEGVRVQARVCECRCQHSSGVSLVSFLPSCTQVVAIPSGGELMNRFKEVSLSGLKFEGVPNRNSLKYRSLYGINQVETLLRGSLRNKVCACSKCTAVVWCGVL